MEPGAAAGGFLGWFAPEEDQKLSKNTPRKMAAAALSEDRQQGGGVRARTALRRRRGRRRRSEQGGGKGRGGGQVGRRVREGGCFKEESTVFPVSFSLSRISRGFH
jgi:hypothetical protein